MIKKTNLQTLPLLTEDQKSLGRELAKVYSDDHILAETQKLGAILRKRSYWISIGKKWVQYHYVDNADRSGRVISREIFVNNKPITEFKRNLTPEMLKELQEFEKQQYDTNEEISKLIYDIMYKSFGWGAYASVREPKKFGLKSIKKQKFDYTAMFGDLIEQVIEYLNMQAGTSFKPTTKEYMQLIADRATQGYKLADFKAAIDRQVTLWLNDPIMAQYLTPSTLFRESKFPNYVHGTVFGTGNAITQQAQSGDSGAGAAQQSTTTGFNQSKPTGTPANGQVGKSKGKHKSVENLQGLKRKRA